MNEQENKAIISRFVDVINDRNFGLVDEIISEDYIQHNPQIPPGREGVKQFYGMFLAAFPDASTTLEHLVAEGDIVVAHYTLYGTHQGSFLGIPPTGRQVRFSGVDIFRMAGGKAVEHWDVADNLSLLQQLGAIPAPGQG